jgi:signal transduction histidine kinase
MASEQASRLGRHGVTALAAAFAMGALAEDLVRPTVHLDSGTYDRGPEAVVVTVLAGVVVLLALRSRLGILGPLGALVLFGLAAFPASAWLLDSSFVYLLVMLSCGLVGYLTRSTRDVAGLLVVWAAGTVAVWQYPDSSVGRALSVTIFMSLAWLIGLLVRRPVQRAITAEERAAQLEQEQEAAARQAVADERQRIARELHDIIAHSVSVMTVQAGAVRRRLTDDQETERDSLLAVERTGREAMAEMRRLVGLLRDADGDAPSYGPQPGLQSLETLIGTVRGAGLPVDLTVEGTTRELPPGTDLAAYRVVQEALTNALRHAGPARAWVRVHWGADELTLEVTNDGRTSPDGNGYGQVGMQERLRIYGGRLESGARPEGGYVVRAHVPIGPVP